MPARPDPPRIDDVTHHSAFVKWHHPLDDGSITRSDRPIYTVQMMRSIKNSSAGAWSTIYKGYGHECSVSNLDEQANYQFRVKVTFKKQESDWSGQSYGLTKKKPTGSEPLHNAVVENNLQQVKEFLDSDSGRGKLNSPDKFGFTPLMRASVSGLHRIVALLIRLGADVNKQDVFFKRTSLMLACGGGHTKTAEVILKETAVNVELCDEAGCTALMWAVDHGHLDTTLAVVQRGADVRSQDCVGRTALHHAASTSDCHRVVPVLTAAGADVDAEDTSGLTPLMLAALSDHHHVAEVLIDCGANIGKENKSGHTALDIAKSVDSETFVRCLEKKIEELTSSKNLHRQSR